MILKLKDISLSFTDSRNETLRLLNGLSLDVPKGKVTALVGGNGAGKTTLFNIISGFQNADQGAVIFDGKDISQHSPNRVARHGIGRLFQGRQLFGDLTLLENMKTASDDSTGEFPFSFLWQKKHHQRKEREKEDRAKTILSNFFGADNKYEKMLSHPASAFSHGEQRLLGLARLLMGKSSLLLLDEPTSGVNPVYIETIGQIIKRMVRELGLSVLLIEHNMQFVREIADYCAYLDEGKIRHQGTAHHVLGTNEVCGSYLGLVSSRT